jgi:hypothetical protein
VLADKSMLTEKEVIAAISLETNHPPIDIEKVTVDEDVLETISQESAEMYCVLPLAKIGNFLTVAAGHAAPLNIFYIK